VVAEAQQAPPMPADAANLAKQLEEEEAPRGRLLDLTGRPIAGAVARCMHRDPVSAVAGNSDPVLAPDLPVEERDLLRTIRTSDATGRFYFLPEGLDDLEPGRMTTLRVETPQHGVFEVNVAIDKQFDVHVPTVLAATAPELKDVAKTDLAGIVVDERGQPLEGVQVDAWSWFPGHETVTGKDGVFHLKKVQDDPPTEGVQVRFSKAGYSPETFFAQPSGNSKWVVALSNKTWVEGIVTRDGRGTIARIRADQGPKELDGAVMSNHVTETYSDSEGRFKLLLQPDRYSFHVVAHGLGVAKPESMIVEFGKHPKLEVALTAGASLSLKAVDSQTGLVVPNVRIFRWEDKDFDLRTNDRGEAVIDDLLPGDLEFSVEGDGLARWWSDEAANQWSRKQPETPERPFRRNFDGLAFKLAAGEAKSATIVVEKDVVITGRVLSPDGQPVAGATAAPALTGTANSLTGDTRFSVSTKEDGTFEMRLPASHRARYNLVAHDGAYDQWRSWANGVLPPIQTVPGQKIENVEIRLTRGGSVKGRVLDRAGLPCPRVQVRAQAADQLENRYYDPTTITNDDGSFEIRLIRPGDHTIESLVHASGALYISDSRSVTVKAGETVEGIEVRHRATREQLAGGNAAPLAPDAASPPAEKR
jgi:hypothetical protein